MFSIGIASCKTEPKYKPTIPDQKLKLIFKDVVIASEAVSLYADENQDSMYNLFMNQIAQIHKVPREEIESNLDMLKSNEDVFLKLCDSLAIELRKQEKDIRFSQNKEKQNAKSVNKDANSKKTKGPAKKNRSKN